MNIRNQTIGARCVPVAMLLFGLSLVPVAQFVPPMAPTMPPEDVAAFFHDNASGVIIGMILFLISGTLLAPITAFFALQIKRIEGVSSILTYRQLITGTIALALFVLPPIFWTAAAYRADRSLGEFMLLNDLGWFSFIMIAPPGILQAILLGVAILQDKRQNPLFPRWVGYLNLWGALLYIPGGLVALFKTGAFAWNGVIAFWTRNCSPHPSKN